MTAPAHTFDIVHGALRVLYPSVADTYGDLTAAHGEDEPDAYDTNEMQWYADRGIDTTGKSRLDVIREYWIGTAWIVDASNIRVTEDGQARVTENDLLREVD